MMEIEAKSRHRRDVATGEVARLLGCLDQDPIRAWGLYHELRQKLVVYFEHYRYFSQAEELADETLDEIAKKPDLASIRSIAEFAFGVARNVRMRMSERLRRSTTFEDGAGSVGGSKTPENHLIDIIDRQRKLEWLLSYLRDLSSGERFLIFQYYPNDFQNLEKRREQLAKKLGIDINALRARVFRLRDKIEQHLARRRANK